LHEQLVEILSIWSAARDPEIYTKYWMCMISRPAEDNKSYEWRIMCHGADPMKRIFFYKRSFGTTLPAVTRRRWRIGTPVRSWWCACCNSSNISAACIVHTGFRRIMINLLEYLQLDVSGIVSCSSYVNFCDDTNASNFLHRCSLGLRPGINDLIRSVWRRRRRFHYYFNPASCCTKV